MVFINDPNYNLVYCNIKAIHSTITTDKMKNNSPFED